MLNGISHSQDSRGIAIHSTHLLTVLSSAVVGGDLDKTRHILNLRVVPNYECGTHSSDLSDYALELGITEPFVGLLTAAPIEYGQILTEQNESAAVLVAVTLGLSHPTAAGVTPAIVPRPQPGTINTIIVVDASLPLSARVNLIATATEAKTLALVEANIRAPHGGLATGTVTDAIVLATTQRGTEFEYGGPISPIGALVARVVRRAMQQALLARGFITELPAE